MRVQLKLYGVFRSTARASEISLEISDSDPTVRAAIRRLVSREDLRGLKALLMDDKNSDVRSNALIMVSGREINTLNGLDTALTEDAELTLLPVAHGG